MSNTETLSTEAPWEVVDKQVEEAPTLALTKLTAIEATLVAVEAKHKGVVYDLATTAGNDAARKARQELVTIRTTADKVYGAWNKPILAAQAQARALRDGFQARVLAIEEPLDKAIKADEARRAAEKKAREEAEARRIKAIRDRIAQIFALPAAAVGAGSVSIEVLINVDLPMLLGDKTFFEELAEEAEAAAAVVAQKLGGMLVAARAAEAEAERQRLEAERLAAERAELERQRAELARQRAEAEAAARAEEERRAREAAAAEAARQAQLRQEQEAIAEQLRQAQEARRQAEEAQAAARRAQEELEAAQRAEVERQARAAQEEAERQAAAQEAAAQAAAQAEAAQAMLMSAVEPVVTEQPCGAKVIVYPPVDPVKPPPTEQVDAFPEERAAAAEQAKTIQPQILRPADERITAAVAKAFDVAEMVAAEWLGTYDVYLEIDRIAEAA